jgi:site-specific DNA-cytosine methylase
VYNLFQSNRGTQVDADSNVILTKNSMTTQMVELFAGIGGFRLAGDALGIDTIWANDIDPKAAQIYQQRFKRGTFVQGDLKKYLHQTHQPME